MKERHWFLPERPDVLGQLRRQVTITIDGLDAFARWASTGEGEEAVGDAVRNADAAKRELLAELRAAFITPLEPEDVFALSRGVDRILNAAHDIVTESRLLDVPPDAEVAEMAELIAQAVRHFDAAVASLDSDPDGAAAAADAAIAAEKALHDSYIRGMVTLLDVGERSARIGGRELYRRCTAIGDMIVEVAERVVYAVVKES